MGRHHAAGRGQWRGRSEHAPAARGLDPGTKEPNAMKGSSYNNPFVIDLDAVPLARIIGVGILIFVVIVLASSTTYIVQPGHRGVAVTLGKVSPAFKPEGFGLKQPFITQIHATSVRQRTRRTPAE